MCQYLDKFVKICKYVTRVKGEVILRIFYYLYRVSCIILYIFLFIVQNNISLFLNTQCHINSGSNSESRVLKVGRIGPELAIWLASNARSLRDEAELRDEHRSWASVVIVMVILVSVRLPMCPFLHSSVLLYDASC